jgi:hypothetical protein
MLSKNTANPEIRSARIYKAIRLWNYTISITDEGCLEV